MYIYLATAWNNRHTKTLKRVIMETGHVYYHFLDSGHELDYDKIEKNLRRKSAVTQAGALHHPMVLDAARSNKDALNRADLFVLAEPAGKGCYTEYGMALRMMIPTLLYVTAEYDIGVMDADFKHVVYGKSEFYEFLASRI